MKKIRVGINGFGRIGRVAARIAINRNTIELVAINSRADSLSHAYLLRHDTTYGLFAKDVSENKGNLQVEDNLIKVFQENEPSRIPWGSIGVEVVIESTGIFRDKISASAHLHNGAKLVVISAPPKDEIPTFCVGVNDYLLELNKDKIISNASCTTNCLATVAMVLEENFGIVKGFMTTVHSYTDSQNLLDNSHRKDLRLARSAPNNMIPSSTGASKALGLVLPSLKGKIISSSLRVPLNTVSLIDLTVELKKEADADHINKAFENAAQNKLSGIMELSYDHLVSSDIKGSTFSSIVDGSLTAVNGKMVNVKAWYDNEWGYTSRLIDLVEKGFSKLLNG
ncbi:type I glyceraldehyde-3-phosphate dehydrogenase [Candidatus Gottesmanbacteria bacterium RIFCSPHIGHO2_02_FULL_40_13]|uniref:Glyceraldehyde-3-phosphate dehydrogenase n=1 Tax=Candidatus Gottesmanbacteria bacterium RIFCSPHIGHO2_02_FULL_40_13 TaxID=1798384 RepID=A0A1F6A5N0_9BACT|nr:MAG: type I glyceraldehyde-3-phosphate dehydrogenase [Candidatus Gottesmanbacteria bacterium RIFCSPHIGHO2_02_FULL_40_13]